MTREKFEFTDPNAGGSETNLTMASGGRKNGGCYVSGVVGVALTLVAILIAVGVGLIVHLAEGERELVCQCGSGDGHTGAASADAIKQQCEQWAGQGDQDICGQCPAHTPPGGGTSLTTTPTPGETTPPSSVKVTDVRLSDHVYPEHYDVMLQPYMYSGDPADFTFKGSVKIYVRCDKASNNVTLHINVLTVDETSIRFRGEPPMRNDPSLVGPQYDTDRQFIILQLNRNMQVGRTYTVEMSFTSPLRDDLKGLYYSTYTRDGQPVYLATTQLQPTDARKTFPCFDEPAIKSTFNVTLVRPQHLVSISNMPIRDNSSSWTEDGMTYVADVYEQTPKMSTYLLAFIVCDFRYKEGRTSKDIQYRAWAIPESINETDYALATGMEIISYFADYFEVPYPLPKQDMIAIPDFAAGAMENWGLITYRETAMLFKDGVSNEFNRERVAIVVSHELAHMWFGDLVTPSWWDDLWLNEGFASFVEYMGVDHVHPDWKMFEKFVVSDLQNAFNFDGLISSHPVYVPVAHPDEINEIFDTISYAKGASIIRMMRHFLGLETFRLGMKMYLTEREYDAAFHDDLWDALTRQSRLEGKDLDVKAIMDTWTLQMNYPVVTVSRDFNDLNTVHVIQERYLIDPAAPDPGKYTSPFDYHWTIPLTFTSHQNPNFDQNDTHVHWMYKNETTKTFHLGANNLPSTSDPMGWILANVQQNGYYRVNYQLGNWKALTDQLQANHTVIAEINRAQIINDAWNLAKSGTLDLSVALSTLDYLSSERESVPWDAAVTEISYVNTMLGLSSLRGAFTSFMRAKLTEPYTFFGLDNTGASHTQTYARALVASQACNYGIQECKDAASTQFAQWMNNPRDNRIDPNLKSTVYCYAILNGGWDEWKFALEVYQNETVASEKARLLSSLSCSDKPWILNNYLHLILLDQSPIRKQDALTVISSVSRSVVGTPVAWNFFRANYGVLLERFGTSFFAWTRVIGDVTKSFNTQFDLDQIEEFVAGKSGQLATGERAFQQAVEKTVSNIRWMEQNVPVLSDFLAQRGFN